MFKIEKGIEITRKNRADKGKSKYPFNEMDIGDSVFLPKSEVKWPASIVNFWNSRNADKRLTSRHAIENEILGTRVWRIK